MNPPSSAFLDNPPVNGTGGAKPDVIATSERLSAPTPTPTPAPTPPPSPPTSNEDSPKRSGGFRRGLWAAVKVLAFLVVIAAIVVAAVFGWTELDNRLSDDARTTSDSLTAVDERISTDSARIAELEEQVATLAEAGAVVPSRLDELDSRLSALADEQSVTNSSADDLQRQIDVHTDNIASLDAATQALEATAVRIDEQLVVGFDTARSMELMSRAQVSLYQANYGLALEDITSARRILAEIDPQAAGEDADAIVQTVERLDLAIAALPDRPVIAADDLAIAWRLLLGDPPVTSTRSLPSVAVDPELAADTPVESIEPSDPAVETDD